MSDVTDLIERLRAVHGVTFMHEGMVGTQDPSVCIEAADALERSNRPADDVVEAARKAIVSYVFSETQPDRGDVFSWLDDHAEQIARVALASPKQTDAVEAERASGFDYARPIGTGFDEWRKNARGTALYQRGDMVLVWVNEGDLDPSRDRGAK